MSGRPLSLLRPLSAARGWLRPAVSEQSRSAPFARSSRTRRRRPETPGNGRPALARPPRAAAGAPPPAGRRGNCSPAARPTCPASGNPATCWPPGELQPLAPPARRRGNRPAPRLAGHLKGLAVEAPSESEIGNRVESTTHEEKHKQPKRIIGTGYGWETHKGQSSRANEHEKMLNPEITESHASPHTEEVRKWDFHEWLSYKRQSFGAPEWTVHSPPGTGARRTANTATRKSRDSNYSKRPQCLAMGEC